MGLPVLNGAAHLRAALTDLLHQDMTDFELVIVDNASDDETPDICQEFASQDSRVRVHRFEERVGVAQNFNRALDLARGPYFMWAAHDDLREAGFIGRLLEALRHDSSAVLAFSRFDNIDVRNAIVGRDQTDWPRMLGGTRFGRVARFCLSDEARTQKGNLSYGLFRRDVLIECGGIVQSKHEYGGDDVILLLRALTRGQFAFVDDVLFHYRVPFLPSRGTEPLGSYLLGRIKGRRAGHRGNLVLAIRRTHALHSGLRHIIRSEAGLMPLQTLQLIAALWIKEVTIDLHTLTSGVLREIRSHSYRFRGAS